jgi:hypothetical protein
MKEHIKWSIEVDRFGVIKYSEINGENDPISPKMANLRCGVELEILY